MASTMCDSPLKTGSATETEASDTVEGYLCRIWTWGICAYRVTWSSGNRQIDSARGRALPPMRASTTIWRTEAPRMHGFITPSITRLRMSGFFQLDRAQHSCRSLLVGGSPRLGDRSYRLQG